MVYYFKSEGVSDDVDFPITLFMGKNKEENEDLIKYGLPTDVWFHVDNLSSAHVYLRLPEDWKWDQIPQEILVDCAQLTKANSIQGNKQDNITIIYTPWANLHKTNGMAVGQVGFKKANQVKKVHIPIRVNAIVNRLNKTKIEEYPNLQQERVEYDKEQKRLEIENRQRRLKEEKQVERERKQLKHQRDHAYDDLFNDENVRHSSNQDNEDAEDDFW